MRKKNEKLKQKNSNFKTLLKSFLKIKLIKKVNLIRKS